MRLTTTSNYTIYRNEDMRTEEISKMKIDVYNGANQQIADIECPLIDFLTKTGMMCNYPYMNMQLNEMRKYRKHEGDYDKIKRALPCATISCTCKGEVRNIMNAVRNPLIVIDIDYDKEKGENIFLEDQGTVDKIQGALFRLPYVYSIGKSSSGHGLFAVILLDSNDDEDDLHYHYYALEDEFAKHGITLDEHCKDSTRLRFVSQDTPLIKTDCEITPYSKKVYRCDESDFAYSHKDRIFNVNYANNLIYDDMFVYYLIKEIIDCGYQSESYNRWLNDGFSLAQIPFGDELFMYLSQNSPGFKNSADVEKKYCECEKKSNYTREDAVIFYFGQAKKILGPDWIQIIKNKIK